MGATAGLDPGQANASDWLRLYLEAMCVRQAACCDTEGSACASETAATLVPGHGRWVTEASNAHRNSRLLQPLVSIQDVPCVLQVATLHFKVPHHA